LILGTGSMGKRRIRNLLSIGIPKNQIHVHDVKTTKMNSVMREYGVASRESIETEEPLTLFICTSPLAHFESFQSVEDFNLKCVFVEAGLNPEIELDIHRICEKREIYSYFSTTMNYFPFVKEITRIINNGEIGRVLHVQYSSGQNLNDWHPNENIADYYVTKVRSSATREIVCFELTWLSGLFGAPKGTMASIPSATCDIFQGIADSYSLLYMTENDIALTAHIDIVSTEALRSIQIQGKSGHLSWSNKEGLKVNFKVRKSDEVLENVSESILYDNPYELEVTDFLAQKFTRKDFVRYLQILTFVESSLPSPVYHLLQEEINE